jgi:hypothetical protein
MPVALEDQLSTKKFGERRLLDAMAEPATETTNENPRPDLLGRFFEPAPLPSIYEPK